MDKHAIDLGVFLQPRSVAVIGASDKPGSWGSFMMGGLAAWRYPGTIYPVNRRAGTVSGRPAFPDVRDIPGEVDLAVAVIPAAVARLRDTTSNHGPNDAPNDSSPRTPDAPPPAHEKTPFGR